MSFTDAEITYLRSQPLGRLATVSDDGQPDVVPIGFDFDGTYLYVSGYGDHTKTKKFRNVLDGNAQVALVIDDLVSTDPWTPRFLRVYGTADVVERGRLRRNGRPTCGSRRPSRGAGTSAGARTPARTAASSSRSR